MWDMQVKGRDFKSVHIYLMIQIKNSYRFIYLLERNNLVVTYIWFIFETV